MKTISEILTEGQGEPNAWVEQAILAHFESLVPEKLEFNKMVEIEKDKYYFMGHTDGFNQAIDQFHKNIRRSDG